MMANDTAAANEDARSDALERILQLAQAERVARNSPKWKTASGDAVDEHGACCERLYDELYRQLDKRSADGHAVEKWKPPPDVREELRKSIVRALRAELPNAVAALVDDIVDHA
jgi:hypothetical protein